MRMRSVALLFAAVVGAVGAFAPTPLGVTFGRPAELEACRRNTKKEKRKRNFENMRQFQRTPNAQQQVRVGGKKKTLSRKKISLRARAEKEKARENAFMARLFLATGGAEEKKLDLGLL